MKRADLIYYRTYGLLIIGVILAILTYLNLQKAWAHVDLIDPGTVGENVEWEGGNPSERNTEIESEVFDVDTDEESSLGIV